MALGRQFRLMRDTYDPRSAGYGGPHSPKQRNYRVVDAQDQVHAEMGVMDYSNTPVRRDSWNNAEGNWNHRDPNFNSTYGEPRSGQHVLFDEVYEGPAGRSKLVNAAMTKGARVMALPMLAQAAADTAEAGRQLKPSDNLSKHSAPLVARLKDAGLVDADAVDSASNSVDFMEETWPLTHVGAGSVRDDLDLQAASRKGRAILKATSRRHVPGFFQPRLFE